MKQYLNFLKYVLENGEVKSDRTGVGTISLFGHQVRYDIKEGKIPLLTTKKIFTKGVIEELLWFLRGETNIKSLQEKGVHIWDEWANKEGELGPIYGKQWRNWLDIRIEKNEFGGADNYPIGFSIDQIENVIHSLIYDPNSRRHIVSAWNVADLPNMALQPCHVIFQFYVNMKGELSCQFYQRSADIFLGVPFNIASYAILTHMIAQVTKLKTGELIHTIGDAHIYLNHITQVKEQLSRTPLENTAKVELNTSITNINDFNSKDIKIIDYISYPAIKADIAI